MSESGSLGVDVLLEKIRAGHGLFSQWPSAEWVQAGIGDGFEELVWRAGGDRVCTPRSQRLALTVRGIWEASSAQNERIVLERWLLSLRQILIEDPDRLHFGIDIHLGNEAMRRARALVHDSLRDTELPHEIGWFQIPAYFRTTHLPDEFQEYLRRFSPAVENRLEVAPGRLADAMDELLPSEAPHTLGRRRANWILVEACARIPKQREGLQEAIHLPRQGEAGFDIARETVAEFAHALRKRAVAAGGDAKIDGFTANVASSSATSGGRHESSSIVGSASSFEEKAKTWLVRFHGACENVPDTIGIRIVVLLLETRNRTTSAEEIRKKLGHPLGGVKKKDGHRSRVSTELGKAKTLLRKEGLTALATYLEENLRTRGGFRYVGEPFRIVRVPISTK